MDQECILHGIRGQILLEMLFTVKQTFNVNSNSNCTYFCPGILHIVFRKSDTSSTYIHRDIGSFAQVIAILEIEEKLLYALLILYLQEDFK